MISWFIDFIRKVKKISVNINSIIKLCCVSNFREEARKIIHSSVGGDADDKVIFCGSGATGAVHKLVHSLRYQDHMEPIVFSGPFEHHSSILPWRDIGAKVRFLKVFFFQASLFTCSSILLN